MLSPVFIGDMHYGKCSIVIVVNWVYKLWISELLMRFQDVAFLPTEIVFTSHFLNVEVVAKTSGPPHVLGLWLGVSKGMLPVKYFYSNRASFCVSQISW